MSQASRTENPVSYPSTQWTMVIEVIQSDDEAKALAALDVFCQQYRDVICGFFRRRVGPERAENYTQEFFLKKIHRKWDDKGGLLFQAKRMPGGKFRFFLVRALRFFCVDMARVKLEPVDESVSEPPDLCSESEQDKIEQDCDREVALGVIRRVLKQLQISDTYLRYFSKQITAEEGAQVLGLTTGTFRVAAFRLRPKIKKAFEEEVKVLVVSKEDLADEIRHLMRIFVNSGNGNL